MISRVELENWKAHKRFLIDLLPGINFVMGPNGLGKTSLLEAISFGIIGETTTVDDPQLLVREPKLPARVTITFGNDGTRQIVERKIDPNRKPTARLTTVQGKSLSTSPKGVTSAIAGFYGTNPDFFKRIVYMPEGEVYRFINEPPGRAVMGQIEELLGIQQLKALRDAAKSVAKALKIREARYRDFLGRFDRIANTSVQTEIRSIDPFAALEQVEREQQTLLARMGEIGGRLAEIHARTVVLEQVTEDTASFEKLIADLKVPPGRDPVQVITSRCQDTEKQIEQLRSQLEATANERGKLEGQAEGYRDALKLLNPQENVAVQNNTISCPVCGKPLTPPERTAVLANLNGRLQKIDNDQSAIQVHAQELQRDLRSAQSQLEPLRRALSQVEQLHTRLTETRDLQATHSQLELLRAESGVLGKEQTAVSQKLSVLQQQVAAIGALRSELTALGFRSVHELREGGLVECYRGIILLDAADQAFEATLQQQLDEGLGDVYSQIALVWKHFVHRHQDKDADWEVRFDPQGAATIGNIQTQRVFDIAQLSGGEKTALLVMVHTILARYFSKTDFLMIDEPLEHLDSVNRRSLIRFLVDAYSQGYFKQIIITTFEESLVRRYLTDPNVHVTHLDTAFVN